MADRSYEWAKTTRKLYHEVCSGLARLWKCMMMKFLQENNLFLHVDDR